MNKKRVVSVMVALLLAAVLTFFLIRQQRLEQQRSEQRFAFERQMSSYFGVKIGASKDEVGYVLGYPSTVHGQFRPDPAHKEWQISDALEVNQNGDVVGAPESFGGSAMRKYDQWDYDRSPDDISVEFDERTKRLVSISCMWDASEGPSKCERLFGITAGSSEEQVIRALGRPAKESLSGIYKNMSFPQLGLDLMLTEGRAYLVRKSAPSRPRARR